MPIRRPNLLDAFRQARELPARPAGGAASGPGSVPAKATPQPLAAQPAVTPTSGAPAPVRAPQPTPPPSPAPRPTIRPQPAVTQPLGAPASSPTPTPPQAQSTTPRPPPTVRPESPSAPAMTTSREVPRTLAPAAEIPAPRRERVILLGLALAVATLVLVALLRGGDDAGEMVAAAPPAATAPPPAKPIASEPPPTNPSRTKYDNELYDTANRNTVRLIQYPNDARGLALATDTYRWLIKNGYPVGSPILLANGKGIVLCADAKPTEVELIPLRDNLRGLRYPTDSKDRPFATAFVDKIDNVLAR